MAPPDADPSAQFRLAVRLQTDGRLKEAFEAYQPLLHVDAHKADVASNLSILCLQVGDRDGAERYAPLGGGDRSQSCQRLESPGAGAQRARGEGGSRGRVRTHGRARPEPCAGLVQHRRGAHRPVRHDGRDRGLWPRDRARSGLHLGAGRPGSPQAADRRLGGAGRRADPAVAPGRGRRREGRSVRAPVLLHQSGRAAQGRAEQRRGAAARRRFAVGRGAFPACAAPAREDPHRLRLGELQRSPGRRADLQVPGVARPHALRGAWLLPHGGQDRRAARAHQACRRSLCRNRGDERSRGGRNDPPRRHRHPGRSDGLHQRPAAADLCAAARAGAGELAGLRRNGRRRDGLSRGRQGG